MSISKNKTPSPEEETRATELILANQELRFQNEEKEKRAAELVIANKELVFQNEEKEKRAAELVRAYDELAFQKEEKEKRAAELVIANKELESFTFISSHDLQEPLRKIQIFADRILTNEYLNLSASGRNYFDRIQNAALHMQTLINDLLAYSRANMAEGKIENCDLNKIVTEVKLEMEEELQAKNATIEVTSLCDAHIIPFQFRQLLRNLVSNSLKFSVPGIPPHIIIEGRYLESFGDYPSLKNGCCHITVSDNGIGFNPMYKDRIFGIFQRLNLKEEYEGTGIGLTIVKKIVENHKGIITATSHLDEGASFDIYLPVYPAKNR